MILMDLMCTLSAALLLIVHLSWHEDGHSRGEQARVKTNRNSSARGRGETSHRRTESVTRRHGRGDSEQSWPRGQLEAVEAESGGLGMPLVPRNG